jgi:drug/metabolite transporter (DMT)-like permease
VVTAVLAVAIEKKVPTRTESFALLVLVSGVMVAVWEGAAGSLTGILICVAGNKIIIW